MNAPSIEPWDRQPYDTDESWPVFQAFRESYPRRSFVDTFDGMPISPVKVARWMKAHFWKERADCWDMHLDGLRQETQRKLLEQATKEITAEHMEITALGRKVARKELEKLLVQVEAGAYNAIKPAELIRLMDNIVKLDRLIRNETTEKVESHVDLSGVPTGDLADLEARLKAVLGSTP
jgi:replicative superfamily II helicase